MILSTDSTANLPVEYYSKLNISMIPMQIVLENKVYNDLSPELAPEIFYSKMSAGATPTTAQINEFAAKEYFENLLKKGEDILHISFSSALSGSTTTMKNVAEELNANSKNKIYVVDSLNAAGGEGILVMHAYNLIKEGKKITEIVEEIEKMRPLVKSLFTVQDLRYLVRGGRVSKVSGFIGNVLNIKPILKVSVEGKLVPHKKVISRKFAIRALYGLFKENVDFSKTNYLYINHALCEEDAKRLSQMIEEDLHLTPILTDLTQVIGCHTGPGLLAVFFIGKGTGLE